MFYQVHNIIEEMSQDEKFGLLKSSAAYIW